MATSFKNIVITPNIANNADPSIVFSGANATVNSTVTMFVYPAANGTLSFEGPAGQLFSITGDLSNSIFSVNDISGIPAMEAFANGQLNIATVYGNVSIGSNSTARNVRVTNRVILGNQSTIPDFSTTAPLQIQDNSNNFSEVQLVNDSTGASASGDYVVTDDQGNSTQGFIDLGLNGSGFNDAAFTIVGPRAGYVYTQNGSIAFGTASAVNSVILFAGSTLANSAKIVANATFTLITNSTSNVAIFNANGQVTLANIVTITGIGTFSNNVTVAGNTTLSGTLGVTGVATFSNTVSVTGNTVLSSTLNVAGIATFSNSITVAGATTLSATLAVTGNTTLSNTITLAPGTASIYPLRIPTGTVTTTVSNGAI